ncbi:hypothetical protein ACS0TY_015721 [Phlomoides rotata]
MNKARHIGVILGFHTQTRIVLPTYGSGPSPSPPSPGSILTCGNSLPNSIGMTRQCFLSNITGRPRTSLTNLGGIKWTKKYETRTTSTGLSTSLESSSTQQHL